MAFPIPLNFPIPHLYNGQNIDVSINTGLTVLVGPNGSGKTQFLKTLKGVLQQYLGGRKVRYLSPGRMSLLENYRSNTEGHGIPTTDNVSIAIADNKKNRHLAETAYGDFLTLDVRPDILIKVKERLEKLFKRHIILEWNSGNLNINFAKLNSTSNYSSANEASGLLQIVSLLAALYDDEVAVLLINEPEVSLHPQLQSFLLKEIRKLAGDPSNINKKIIVLSTHSTEFISIRSPEDICNIIFFNNADELPCQIPLNAPELNGRQLRSQLTQLGLNKKLAFFCNTPLLVEGPSDQTVCTALEYKLNIFLDAAGAQIVPVIGTGQIPEVYKLFRKIGKSPVILTDIDSFADGLTLINSLQFDEKANEFAHQHGADTIMRLAKDIYDTFCELVQNNWEDVRPIAERHSIWIERDTGKDDMLYQRRSAMAILLNSNEELLAGIENSSRWKAITKRLQVLLTILGQVGCFILKKGYIENYYAFTNTGGRKDKIIMAEEEAMAIENATDTTSLKQGYADIVDALIFAAKAPLIDEASAISDLILAVATPAISRLSNNPSNESINNLAQQLLGDRGQMFELEIENEGREPVLSVNCKSPILDVDGFPFRFPISSNPVAIVKSSIRTKG